eukprot:35888_1
MSSFRLLFTICYMQLTLSQYIDGCIFMDEINSKWSLDLSSIMNKTIIGHSSAENSTLYYSPCSNKFECTSQSDTSSAIIKENGTCSSLAVWTSKTIPTFDINSQLWSFNYTNNSIELNINWICNSSVLNWNVKTVKHYNNNYLMDIESKYGCLSCIFKQDNEILNLTDFKGINITYISYSEIIWSYTPCWNFTNNAMIIGYVNGNNLLNKFAVWNGDFDLKIGKMKTINGMKRYWEFYFYNYGVCQSDNADPIQDYVAVIRWICNEDINIYNVTSVVWDPMVECQVYINIETQDACTILH